MSHTMMLMRRWVILSGYDNEHKYVSVNLAPVMFHHFIHSWSWNVELICRNSFDNQSQFISRSLLRPSINESQVPDTEVLLLCVTVKSTCSEFWTEKSFLGVMFGCRDAWRRSGCCLVYCFMFTVIIAACRATNVWNRYFLDFVHSLRKVTVSPVKNS